MAAGRKCTNTPYIFISRVIGLEGKSIDRHLYIRLLAGFLILCYTLLALHPIEELLIYQVWSTSMITKGNTNRHPRTSHLLEELISRE